MKMAEPTAKSTPIHQETSHQAKTVHMRQMPLAMPLGDAVGSGYSGFFSLPAGTTRTWRPVVLMY